MSIVIPGFENLFLRAGNESGHRKKLALTSHQLSRCLICGMTMITAFALIFFSWKNYHQVEAVQEAIIHSRTKELQMGLEFQIDNPSAVTVQDLAQAVQNVAPDEITYLAVLQNGQVIADTGIRSLPINLKPSFLPSPFSIQRQERMVQAVAPFHRHHRFFQSPALTPVGYIAKNGTMDRQLLFEFAPVEALQLFGGAVKNLTVSIFTSVLLLIATLFYLRFSLAAERLEKQESKRKRLAALGEMTAVLGHELRNPLTSLKGHAQLLKEGLPACHPGLESLEMVIKETQRLEFLTNHILNFARPGNAQPTNFDVNTMLREAIESLPRDCQVNYTCAPNLPTIFGDQFRLRQAIINLLLNSYQAAPETPVDLHLEQNGRNLIITVRDHGPGLPADSLGQIFDPFFTTKVKGTGLGLAIVKSTIDEFNGQITATNNPGGGAEFSLLLPL